MASSRASAERLRDQRGSTTCFDDVALGRSRAHQRRAGLGARPDERSLDSRFAKLLTSPFRAPIVGAENACRMLDGQPPRRSAASSNRRALAFAAMRELRGIDDAIAAAALGGVERVVGGFDEIER